MNQHQPLAADDPRRLGAYELVSRLGEGGQGVVYLGRSDSGEQVAVKLLHHALVADADARTRFLREVAVAQRVARFCTAPVLHADLDGSRPYIVSEYVPGPSLRELVINEGPRRGAALDRLAISTATALAAIHRAGILHRDFKPANVLMGPEGPVVIDFGIARALDSPGATATGMAMGTPSYLAPEQLSGAPVSEAADVFAWGVTMVYAATGKPAFGADSIPVVMNRILNEEPNLGGMEGMLADLVALCLSKNPAQRPTADGLIAHLTGQPTPYTTGGLPTAGGTPTTGGFPVAGGAPTTGVVPMTGGPQTAGGPQVTGPGAAQQHAQQHAQQPAQHPAAQSGPAQHHPGSAGPPHGQPWPAHGAPPQGGMPPGPSSGPFATRQGGPQSGPMGPVGGPMGGPQQHGMPGGPPGRPPHAGGRPHAAGHGGPQDAGQAQRTRLGSAHDPAADDVPPRQRRTVTLALSGAAAAALLVVAGAIVVQANSKGEVPIVAVGNSSDGPSGGSGDGSGGQPQPPATPDPDVSGPDDDTPTVDIEVPDKKTRKPTTPAKVTSTPRRPDITRPRTTPTPTRTRTKSTEPTVKPSTTAPTKAPTRTPTSRPTTARPTATAKVTPRPTATAKPSPTVKPATPNSTSPTSVCGSGYSVIDSHALGSDATVYLLYNSGQAKNCVVTISRLVHPSKMSMNAILQVQGGASSSDPGSFTSYAGPVTLSAAKKCVTWGGSWGSQSWTSGWSHCS